MVATTTHTGPQHRPLGSVWEQFGLSPQMEWVLLAPGGRTPGLLLSTPPQGTARSRRSAVPRLREKPCVTRLAFLELFDIYLILVEISWRRRVAFFNRYVGTTCLSSQSLHELQPSFCCQQPPAWAQQPEGQRMCISHTSGGWRSWSGCPQGWSGEDSLLASRQAFSMCPHVWGESE